MKKLLIIITAMLFALTLIILQPTPTKSQNADKQEELAIATFEYTGYYAPRYIIEKLMKLNLSESCWNKALASEGGWGSHLMSFVTRDVEYWVKDYMGYPVYFSKIEGDTVPSRKENKDRTAKAVEEIKDKYFITVDATQCDCNNSTTSQLVRNYIGAIGSFPNYERFTPKSGVYFAKLTITPKVKDISASVSKDGKEFSVTAPSEIEPSEWTEKIYKVFRRAAKE